MKLSKRVKTNRESVDTKKAYNLEEAVKVLKNLPTKAKFDESVELAIKLAITQKETPQQVRGTVSLPAGTGKKVKIAVFTKDNQDKATEAGADFVGADELIQKVTKGWVDFDVAIATPDLMSQMSKLGKVLGPKGLMPSPKAGTITTDVVKAINEIKKGKIEFKMDKQANINVAAGKLGFDEKALVSNLNSIITAVIQSKPEGVKGQYIQSIHISSTMGPGLKIDFTEAA